MRRTHKYHRSLPMPPVEEMGLTDYHLDVIDSRMEELEWYSVEERALIAEYDVARFKRAMADANQNLEAARALLAARYGPPLVPRRR